MTEQKELTADVAMEAMRETLEHKLRVASLLVEVASKLIDRAVHHDNSKFSAEEFPGFARITGNLRGLEYGSDEYKASIKSEISTIKRHQHRNSHHPEYHDDGIEGMDMVDLIEMLCDWRAATERHDTGDLRKSLEINKERWGIPQPLYDLLYRTASNLDLFDREPGEKVFGGEP